MYILLFLSVRILQGRLYDYGWQICKAQYNIVFLWTKTTLLNSLFLTNEMCCVTYQSPNCDFVPHEQFNHSDISKGTFTQFPYKIYQSKVHDNVCGGALIICHPLQYLHKLARDSWGSCLFNQIPLIMRFGMSNCSNHIHYIYPHML